MNEKDEKELRALAVDGLLPDERKLRALSSTGQRYMDKYGDLWIRQGNIYVVRLSDGNIGGWFKGKGLNELSL